VAPIFSSILLSMTRSKSSRLAPLGGSGSGGRGGAQRLFEAPELVSRSAARSVL